MTALFDDLPDIFTDPDTGFGEAIVYVSTDTGKKKTINAIWNEQPVLQGMAPSSDAPVITLDVREADVPTPLEGDEVTRKSNKQEMRVVPPIKPAAASISIRISSVSLPRPEPKFIAQRMYAVPAIKVGMPIALALSQTQVNDDQMLGTARPPRSLRSTALLAT